MTTRNFRSSYLQQLHERILAVCERAQGLTEGLDSTQLNWKPASDQWSIAQCYEHMLLGADRYHENLQPAVARAKDKVLYANYEVRPRHTLMGRAIMRAVAPNAVSTMTSPKIFAPSQSDVSSDITDRFVKSHEALAASMADCDGLDFVKLKLSSPVAAIIRINAADAFEILVMHAERHLNQAERVRQSPGFPA